MLLGIPLHVAFAYTSLEYQWLIKDSQNSIYVDWGLYFLRTFRMPLFFIISGFFAHYIAQTRSQKFLLDRVKRLLIPLLILFLIIVCPLRVIWLFGEFWSRPAPFVLIDYFPFLMDNFLSPTTSRFNIPASWGHLWFLLYLFIFSIMSFFSLKFLKFYQLKFKVPFWVLFFLTGASFLMMDGTWVDLPFGIFPRPSLMLYYGCFYYFGWRSFEKAYFRLNFRLSLIVLTIGLLIGFLRSYLEIELSLDLPVMIMILLSSLAPWMISIGLMSSSQYLIKRELAGIQYLVKASYSIYLFHLPVIVLLQLAMSKIPLGWAIKLGIISTLTFLICALFYSVLVKDKYFERFLKGDYDLPTIKHISSYKF